MADDLPIPTFLLRGHPDCPAGKPRMTTPRDAPPPRYAPTATDKAIFAAARAERARRAENARTAPPEEIALVLAAIDPTKGSTTAVIEEATGLSNRRARRALRHLERTHKISRQKGKKRWRRL